MADAPLESLGTRLKQEREKQGWTKTDLAKKINVDERSIRRWENDEATPRPEQLPLLTEVFGKPPEEWGNKRARWNNVPFPKNPYFMGRSLLLERLHLNLTNKTGSLIQALIGLAGIGKTATVLEYAHRYETEYEAVLWVNADADSLVSNFAALAAVLNLPEQHEPDQSHAVEAVKRWLREHSSWLLIFDNADDLNLAFTHLPKGARGAVLLTTHVQAVGPYIEPINLPKINRNDGSHYLLRRQYGDNAKLLASATVQEYKEAGLIWEQMEGLALLLDQAAAYLEETRCTLSDYLALFKTNRKDLMDQRGATPSEHPASATATWLMALQKIEDARPAGPAAAQLLRFCAFLHPKDIPESMIVQGADALEPVLQQAVAEPHTWNKAIGALLTYSLVKRNGEKKLLTVHGLVQAAIMDDMPEEAAREWVERVVRVVSAAFPEPEPGSWPQCDVLLPHALLAARYIETYHLSLHEAGSLVYMTAMYLHTRARYSEAEPLYRQALHLREQGSGREHPDVAVVLNGLADLCRDTSQYAAAQSCYLRALTIREQALGEEHLDVAVSLAGLAELYRDQSNYADAETLHTQALAIREKQLDSEHLLVAASLHMLASVYTDTARYAEAEPLHQRALAIYERAYGKTHLDVARCLNSLAVIYFRKGSYGEAERAFLRVLAIRKHIHGEDHNETAIAMNNLAAVYHEQEKYEEAAALLEKVRHILESLLGKTSSQVARASGNLAEPYMKLERYEEAEQYFKEALQIWDQLTESEHADAVFPLNGLANLCWKQGRYAEAEELYRRGIRIGEQMQNTQTPEAAMIMYDFAQFWHAQNNPEEARAWGLQAFAIQKKVLGKPHSSTEDTRRLLIAVLRALGGVMAEVRRRREGR